MLIDNDKERMPGNICYCYRRLGQSFDELLFLFRSDLFFNNIDLYDRHSDISFRIGIEKFFFTLSSVNGSFGLHRWTSITDNLLKFISLIDVDGLCKQETAHGKSLLMYPETPAAAC
jgi:hypothetical protein